MGLYSRVVWQSFVSRVIAAFLLLFLPTCLLADNISGTVHDPSGAVIAGARIEITGGDLTQPLILSSDAVGAFTSPDVKPGTYTVRIVRDGFEPLVKPIDLKGAAQLQLTLAIAKREVTIAVSGKSAFANSDPIYRQLRGIGFGDSYRVNNFTVTCDVGTFQFQKGSFTLLAPVNGIVTGAIFIGEGHFSLKPFLALDIHELERRMGEKEVNEDFNAVVFRFTPEGRSTLSAGFVERTDTPAEAAAIFNHWREHMRQRQEQSLVLPQAWGFSQALLQGDTMDNVDADVLSAVYNPKHPTFFNAYIHGHKYKDLRFFLRARVGAVPQIDSPEEVSLINFDPEGMEDGVWYLAHLKSEYLNRTANSREDRRLFATHNYKIETMIAKNGHLFSTAAVTFEPLVTGERVLKFGLLPNLRVTRVTDDSGQDLYFIQESRKEDGSFYAILPQAPPLGQSHTIHVEYAGDKVLENAGEGSYYVRARTSWYPNLNGFGEKSLYDLTFKVPRRYKIISVGKLQSESVEGDLAVSHWTTSIPVAVAGFNYGQYKKLELNDPATGSKIDGYYLEELPDRLRAYPALQSLAPKAMTEYAMSQTRTELQICNFYFGKSPYDEISVTEQPDFTFGQSWPSLVYLPISAYTDSTQRWLLFGSISRGFTGFVEEVTPHEISHQWWGHAVGWSSYHDQWLSEGFAEFSAGLYLQKGVAGDWRKDYLEFWERLRKRILEKNNFGVAPNDAGPLWMGLRLIAPRSEQAYQNVTYPKGAYVVQMLRSIMYTNEDQDKAFIEMMHDFVNLHRDHSASTETFQAVAERHMTKQMDIGGNGRLDWFFSEWVYGTQVPRYHFEYQLVPADAGKTKIHMTITQSDVDEHFGMLIPVYADFGKGMIRLGQFGMAGSSTRNVDFIVPMQPKKVALNAFKEILER